MASIRFWKKKTYPLNLEHYYLLSHLVAINPLEIKIIAISNDCNQTCCIQNQLKSNWLHSKSFAISADCNQCSFSNKYICNWDWFDCNKVLIAIEYWLINVDCKWVSIAIDLIVTELIAIDFDWNRFDCN